MVGDWPIRELAELCESVDYGYTASAKGAPCGPKFLRITDIVSGGINWDTVPFCEIEDSACPRFLLRHDDVVIARTGATTGYSAYIANPPDAVFASYLVRLKIRSEADPRFIAYFLKSPRFWDYMRGVMGDKSAQPNASAKTMTQVTLPVPPLKEQRAIACILGALDDKIELNRRMNRTLEAMARAIFKSWFVNFDPVRAKAAGRQPPGLKPDLANLFPDAFEDSELGPIPQRWEVVALKALASIRGGKQLPTEDRLPVGTYPVFGANGIMGYATQATHEGFVIAFGRVGAYCGSIHWALDGAWINNNASAVVPTRWSELILQAMLNIDFGLMRTGSAQPFIPNRSIAAARVLRPSQGVAEAFCRVVGRLRQQQCANDRQSRTLAAMRDALLPRLISGESRVPDAERIIERVL